MLLKALIIITSLFSIVIIYWFLIPKRTKSLFLLLCSLIFISLFSITYALYYLVLIFLVFILGLTIKERPDIKRPLFIATIIFLIANLCFYKYFKTFFEFFANLLSSFIQLPTIKLPEIILPLGLSFITFRLLHYIIEINRNRIQEASFTDFALYSIFFPTFLAGPIERFPNFHKQTKEITRPDYNMICYGLWRILLGIIKKFLIADGLFAWTVPMLQSPGTYSRLVLIGSIYGATIWLYLDFSGYSDIAIGVSRLFGYKIVENFKRPFFQKNIALFWRSWHISLYTWIRDYFYFPFFVYRASQLKLFFGAFLTLMLFILWHGSSSNFLLGGIYSGLGLVIWLSFQNLKRRFPRLNKLSVQPCLDWLSTFVTFTHVSFGIGIFFFTSNIGEIKALISKLFL